MEIVLFVDESSDSERACRLLDAAQLPYRTVASSGPNLPAAKFGETTYQRLSGVQILLRGLSSAAPN
jgi:hypothetical protein